MKVKTEFGMPIYRGVERKFLHVLEIHDRIMRALYDSVVMLISLYRSAVIAVAEILVLGKYPHFLAHRGMTVKTSFNV